LECYQICDSCANLIQSILMTATAHALAGGAIAATVSNPFLGIALATLSHPLLDMIPHWDFGWGWRQKTKLRLFCEGSADLIVGVVVAYLIFGQGVNPWYFFACILVSEAWDLLEIPYWFFSWTFFPFGWIYKFQSAINGKLRLPWGIATQVVAIVAIFLVLGQLHF
jgi:hypothetical protein